MNAHTRGTVAEVGPDPIDVFAGMRLRARRRLLKISQEKLADALGVTFQQVQKYERGANRMATSTLYRAAGFLDVKIGYFVENLGQEQITGERELDACSKLHFTLMGEKLADAFLKLTEAQQTELARFVMTLVPSEPVDGAHV